MIFETFQPIKRFCFGVCLAVVLTTVLQTVAFATTLTMSATDAPAVSMILNGSDQAAADAFGIQVADTRETSTGWSLQITSTTFSDGLGHTLSNAASSIIGVTATCNTGSCTAPLNSIAHPVAVPAGATAPPAVTFFNASGGTGIGDFTITPVFQIDVPANAYAGTYNSTISITIGAGP